ncbi:uncharacterized protein LOC134678087 [Cydia fagiglandana]|uniref:uncharacterized protein LOC134678087 n=1 Tax=Cydia fagiglandana TaxID=1458189 RepID=UPI002FEE3835
MSENATSSSSNSGNATSSSSISGLPSIEKLDGNSNYATWKFMMELYLVHEDLWEYTSATPAATDVSGTKRDQRARAKICLMVRPHCLVHVRKAKSAKEAWEALKNAFEDKGLNNRCRLLSKLVSLRLEQFSSVRDYVTSVMATSQELLDLGKEIDDQLLAALLLQGLTPEFQPMRLAIENSNISLTTDYVKTKLFQMEDTFAAGSSEKQPTSALLTKKHKGKSAPKWKTKGKVKCFICEGPHKAQECPENPKTRKEALQAYAFGTAMNPHADDWIIDSGASSNMTHRKSWFKNLKDSKKPLRVTCANGNEVLGESESTVVCESIDLTISNVTYVPELASNLLSVNAIAKKGHVVVFTEKGCDIFKSDECEIRGKAVVKGVEERGIYKIKCCSQGSALSSATASDQLMQWHRRMGHLGMKNLKLLRDKMATGFKEFAENQSGKKLKILRTDNGTEFVNKQMDNYLKKFGIQHQLTVDYTPEQNGVAERANRTICEKARSMLHDSGLAKRFWAEAVHHAVFLKKQVTNASGEEYDT